MSGARPFRAEMAFSADQTHSCHAVENAGPWEYETHPPRSPWYGRNTDPPGWISTLLQFIDENVERPVTVSDLSRVCGRSGEHIARCFRTHLGTTPSTAINRVRMQRAALLLAHTNRAITDICYSLGFSSSSYFYRRFRAVGDELRRT